MKAGIKLPTMQVRKETMFRGKRQQPRRLALWKKDLIYIRINMFDPRKLALIQTTIDPIHIITKIDVIIVCYDSVVLKAKVVDSSRHRTKGPHKSPSLNQNLTFPKLLSMLLFFILSFGRYHCISQFCHYVLQISFLIPITQIHTNVSMTGQVRVDQGFQSENYLFSCLISNYFISVQDYGFYKQIQSLQIINFKIILKVRFQSLDICISFNCKLMSLQICTLHTQLKDFICAKNECNQLMCKQCFKIHAEITKHSQAVRLSLESKQFFLRWTQYILKRVIHFSQVVTHMGYSKVFQMKLQTNHPKGTVSQLNFQEIQKVGIQGLQQHKKIIEGNLTFIMSTQTISQMIHPEFLKDLYNIACQDAKFNLQNLSNSIQKKLIESYPHKQIYRYSKFNILPIEIIQIEDQRNRLVQEYEQTMMLRVDVTRETPERQNFAQSVIKKEQEAVINQFASQHEKFSKDYHSSSQTLLPDLSRMFQDKYQAPKSQTNEIVQNQQPDPIENISTQQNRSLKDAQQIPRTTMVNIAQIPKQSYEQFTTTIALLRSNEVMYQQKIYILQKQNSLLREKNEVFQNIQKQQKLQTQQKINALQNIQKQQKLQTQQKIAIYMKNEAQIELRRQIQELQTAQQNMAEQNRNLNSALKNIQDIAQGRSRTITSLQQQVKRFAQNVQLKQRSIKQLNQLISNQEEQIAYRQNQVQILGQQIKKLMQRIKFLEESILQLNNVVSNQEEQILYRENQVQNLQQEINNLNNRVKELQSSIKSLNSLIANQEQQITYRENQSDILQKQVKKLLQKIQLRDQCIHELNSLISDGGEQTTLRQNQTQTLTLRVGTLLQKCKKLQRQLTITTQNFVHTNDALRQALASLGKSENQPTPDQQLVEQVVVLEADLLNKNDDIQLLISIVQQFIEKVLNNPLQQPEQAVHVLTKLKGLKTIRMDRRSKVQNI